MLNDFDSNWLRDRMFENLTMEHEERTRPSMLFQPRVFRDGPVWCALYGEDVQEGVVGFGASPALACEAFDAAWTTPTETKP